MHILEHFSLNCGIKSAEAFIQEDFIPVAHDKFICINNDHAISSFNYSYWSDVFDIIKPYLDKSNIKIIQIGSPKDQLLPSCEDFRHIQTRHQGAYIINRSELFIGSDIFYSNIASHFGVPGVLLFGPIPPSCTAPFWHKDKFDILCETEKFSYSSKELEKSIDKIKPEKIANAILKRLKIPFESDQNTLFIGQLYDNKIFEVIPNFSPNPDFLKNSFITMRADYEKSDEHIPSWASGRKVNLITDRKINLNLINAIKSSLQVIHFEISDDCSEEVIAENQQYFKTIKKLGINISLFRKTTESIEKLRLHYFDWNVEILSQNRPDDNILNNKDLFFYSGKLIFSNGKKYPSIEHAVNDLESSSGVNQIIDSELFWSESDHYRIISKSN
jgi:hypothetical protein